MSLNDCDRTECLRYRAVREVTTLTTYTRLLHTDETKSDRVLATKISGLYTSLTHYRYVSLTRDEFFTANWIPDHRNPVQADPHSRADEHQGHTDSAPDLRVLNSGLNVFSEGFAGQFSGEDVYRQQFDEDGIGIKTPHQYIGNDNGTERRVAPRMFYVPERGEFVKFHGDYADTSWDLSTSTSSDLNN